MTARPVRVSFRAAVPDRDTERIPVELSPVEGVSYAFNPSM